MEVISTIIVIEASLPTNCQPIPTLLAIQLTTTIRIQSQVQFKI